jgi:hypothetical protein
VKKMPRPKNWKKEKVMAWLEEHPVPVSQRSELEYLKVELEK